MTKVHDLSEAISRFGAATKKKLANKAVSGAPEDQLRAPLDALFKDIAMLAGIPGGAVVLVGESTLAELSTRPDYAVTVHNALIGFIEIKAPGKGADPRKFTDDHDKRQWGKLKSLPNLLYCDGNSFSLWRDGKLEGSIVHLAGDVETSGTALSAPPALLALMSDFLRWQPIPPRSAKKLAEVSARLCRLLREEVAEELKRNNPGLTSLAGEWKHLLFPDASDEQFADGYAQAATFGLLVARVRNVDLSQNLDTAANELRKSSTLMGTALRLLTATRLGTNSSQRLYTVSEIAVLFSRLVEQVGDPVKSICGRALPFCLIKIRPIHVHDRPAFCEAICTRFLMTFLSLPDPIVDVREVTSAFHFDCYEMPCSRGHNFDDANVRISSDLYVYHPTRCVF